MQGQEENQIAGFLLINKPAGMTSFECVRTIRSLLPKRVRVGHTGTLDAFATGMLIIAIDRTATRHIRKLMEFDKTYIATGKLGQLTDSLDFTGIVLQQEDAAHITKENIEQAIVSFGSEYLQIPPLYSALKFQGERLSELARSKKLSLDALVKVLKYKARIVLLHEFELQKFEPPFFTIHARVSHGSYIRSLLNDIAQKVGTVATTHELQRTQIGSFSIDNAVDLRDIKSAEDIEKKLLSINDVLEKVEVSL